MLIDLFQNLASVNAFFHPIFFSMRSFILNTNLVTRSLTAALCNALCERYYRFLTLLDVISHLVNNTQVA